MQSDGSLPSTFSYIELTWNPVRLSPFHPFHPIYPGSDPATTKQKGFIDALERQKDLSIGEERKENLSKSEASVIIDGLQQSKVIPVATAESNGETAAEPKRKRDDEENEEEKKDDAADVKAGGEREGDTPVPVLDADGSKVASDASPSSNGISYEKKDGKDASKGSENASTADEKSGDVDDKAPPAKKAKTDDAAPSASTTTNDVEPTGPESSILKEDAVAADGSALPPLPKDHLDHADKWVTGACVFSSPPAYTPLKTSLNR